MSKVWRVCVSSPPDRKKVVAEIFFGQVQWAEVNQERGVLEVEFYARPDGEPWRIGFEDVMGAMEEAKRTLGLGASV